MSEIQSLCLQYRTKNENQHFEVSTGSDWIRFLSRRKPPPSCFSTISQTLIHLDIAKNKGLTRGQDIPLVTHRQKQTERKSVYLSTALSLVYRCLLGFTGY